jgi:hypothetical protein
MAIITFSVGDVIIAKKKHPCSSEQFTVMRVGSDIRLVCSGCGRDMTLPRITVEKMTKKIIPKT